jgi:tRNA pseudouridine38-40 synthase
MIEVGHGNIHAGEIRSIMAAHDRHAAGPLAPPHGLSLWEVGYPGGPV